MAQKETVRIRPPQPTDKFGDPTGPEPVWVDVPRCTVVPRESQDYEQRGPIVIHGYLVRMPASTVITDRHEVEVRGEVQQIDGAVADFRRKGKIVYTMRAN